MKRGARFAVPAELLLLAFRRAQSRPLYTMQVDQVPTATFDSVMKARHGVMSSACYAWVLLEAAAKVCEEAEDMIAAGAVGDVVRDTLRHAAELVDVADGELSDAQTDRYQVLAAASPLLRARLRVLRDKAG